MDGPNDDEGEYGPDRDRPRWSLSEEGRTKMEEVYAMNKFPPTAVRERLAREVGGTMRQIQVWFQNRRQRDQSHNPANHAPLVMPFVPVVPAFYPPQQDPLSPYGAQGLPQPIMYGQPPMVPMNGALQNGFLPGPRPCPFRPRSLDSRITRRRTRSRWRPPAPQIQTTCIRPRPNLPHPSSCSHRR